MYDFTAKRIVYNANQYFDVCTGYSLRYNIKNIADVAETRLNIGLSTGNNILICHESELLQMNRTTCFPSLISSVCLLILSIKWRIFA